MKVYGGLWGERNKCLNFDGDLDLDHDLALVETFALKVFGI